jgi:hypothetical protein
MGPKPAVYIDADVDGGASDKVGPIAFITLKASDDSDVARPSTSPELAGLRHEIPKENISRDAISSTVRLDSGTGRCVQGCGRRVVSDLEWPLTPSPEPISVTPTLDYERPGAGLHDVTLSPLSKEFAAQNLPPAPNEANERRRARKYEPEIKQDIQSRRKLLATSFRRNKPPTSWDESSFTHVRHKAAVAGKFKGKDTIGLHPPPHYQLKPLVGSPVYHINKCGSLEDVPVIQLEDRFRQGPTLHEVGMTPFSVSLRRVD